MRFSTAGSFPRFDHSLLVEALVPLREEWAALRFGADGAVVNPLSGEPNDTLRLVAGRHRSPGARYEILTRTPEPSEPAGELTETISRFTLRGDDSRALAVTVTDPQELWSVDIDIVHGRIPRIVLEGRADATAMMVAEDVPRWLARRVGGTATGTATIDLATIEQRAGGTVAEASGVVKLLRGSGSATVTPTPTTWDVAGSADLTGQGLGRLALRLFGKRLRRSFDDAVTAYWKNVPLDAAGWETDLHRIEDVIAAEGGVATVIHRGLWDPAYLEGLTQKYDLE
ncbi:MAG: hypothetical protein ABWX74_13725 [Aeromicrobium sp.]